MPEFILPPSTKTGVYVKITTRLDPRNSDAAPGGVIRCHEIPRNVFPDSLAFWARGVQFALIGGDVEYIKNLVDPALVEEFGWTTVDLPQPNISSLVYGTPGDVWSDVYEIGFCNEYQDLTLQEATFAIGMQFRARRALRNEVA